jgi:hypothetical protein
LIYRIVERERRFAGVLAYFGLEKNINQSLAPTTVYSNQKGINRFCPHAPKTTMPVWRQPTAEQQRTFVSDGQEALFYLVNGPPTSASK